MKAIELQRGNKLHHYWLSQYIKAIVLHQREFKFEFWPIRKFHFIQPGPVPSTILNYCPIRWLLFHLPSWILVQSQAELPSWIIVQSEDYFHPPSCIFDQSEMTSPPLTPPWHRTLTLTLLMPNMTIWVILLVTTLSKKCTIYAGFIVYELQESSFGAWMWHSTYWKFQVCYQLQSDIIDL